MSNVKQTNQRKKLSDKMSTKIIESNQSLNMIYFNKNNIQYIK